MPPVDSRPAISTSRWRQGDVQPRRAGSRARGGRRRALGPDDTAAGLVLDALVFAAEAEVRWLDHVEARLHRSPSRFPSPNGVPA